jgi:molecular chaperone DnaK (HSP70)
LSQHHIVGIDLGTTNSEVAAFVDGQVRVLGQGAGRILPSCVGFAPDGTLLVGEAARNQYALYPERTVRSVKRLMGTDTTIMAGGKTFSPQEISSIILRELAARASKELGGPVTQAIITVPAYFSDGQREATREAGKLAGLEVLRILNEPTAASLAFGASDGAPQTVMVYDLGGGTFDVSIVRLDGNVTEVLASHGDNKLGGDDFDALLADYLCAAFEEEHDIDLRQGHATGMARLSHAAEEAKKCLSAEPFAFVREESLAMNGSIPLHLNLEISRAEYEEMILPLVERSFESVAKAMEAAGVRSGDLDTVLLAGGSTRTPLIIRMLEERTGREPRQDIDPDLCVALGAGVMASRQSGHDVDRILVDVTPYSYGISYLGEMDGYEYEHCYHPIIRHNTPLPVARADSYQTSGPFQTTVQIAVYQGDHRDALRNIPVGDFKITGLTPVYEPSVVLCKMSLDLDGILHVTAIEKSTGLSKAITIDNAFKVRSETEIAEGRRRMQELFGEAEELEDNEDMAEAEVVDAHEPADPAWLQSVAAAEILVERSRVLFDSMHDEDREEAVNLIEAVEDARASHDATELDKAAAALRELLYFVGGK